MIHPYCLLLSILLTASAALGGHIPPVLFVLLLGALKSPRAPASPVLVHCIIFFTAAQLLATFVVNLVTAASDSANDAVFGGSAGSGSNSNSNLASAFGIYSTSDLTTLLAANIPQGIVLIYCCVARNRLTKRIHLQSVSSSWSCIVWSVWCAVTALVSPNLIATAYLVLSACVSATVAFRVGYSDTTTFLVRTCAHLGAVYGTLSVAAVCLCQNAAVADAGTADFSPIFGLSKLFHLSVSDAILRAVQLFLMVTSTLMSLAMTEYRSQQRRSSSHHTPLLATVPNRHSTNHVSSGVLEERQESRRMRHEDTMSIGSQTMHDDVFARLQRTLRKVGLFLMRNLIIIPFFPLACIAANIIVFPSVPSLSLLPAMCAGLIVAPRTFSHVLPYGILLFSPWIIAQYAVLAVHMDVSETIRHIFLSTSIFGLQVLECASNLAVNFVLLATLAQHQRVQRHEQLSPISVSRGSIGDSVEDDVGPREGETIFPRAKAVLGERRVKDICFILGIRYADLLATATAIDEDLLAGTGRSDAARGSDNKKKSPDSPESRSREGSAGGGNGAAAAAAARVDISASTSSFSISTEEAFVRLCQRSPTAFELRNLRQSDPLTSILEDEMRMSEHSAVWQGWRYVRMLVRYYSTPVAMLFTFVAGTFVQQLDVFHGLVLVLFLVYFLVPNVAVKHWGVLVSYIMLLTCFEVVYSFVSQFFVTPNYIAPRIKYRTVGFVPLESQWHAIPYFLVLFCVSLQWQLHSRMFASWADILLAYEWVRFTSQELVLKWRRRFTLSLATAVFVSLGVFEDRSLLVEGFLGLFLVICICAASGISNRVLLVLWCIAILYSGCAMAAVSLFQFSDIQAQIYGTLSNSTIDQIGVVAPADEVLTLYLAPWFVALVASLIHIGTLLEKEAAPVSPMSFAGAMYPSPAATTAQLSASLLATDSTARSQQPKDNNSSSRNREAYEEIGESADPLGAQKSNNISSGNQRYLYYDEVDDDEVVQLGEEEQERRHSARMFRVRTSCVQRYAHPDQRFLGAISVALVALDVLTDVAAAFGSDYGAWFVWIAQYIAATSRYNLMTSGYALFLVLDFSGVAALFYCVVHMLVLYTYQFSFIPKIDGNFEGVDLAELIGFIKTGAATPASAVIGPVLVFFALLFRIGTAGTTSARRKAQIAEGPDTSNWRTFLNIFVFPLVAYEVVALLLLTNLNLCANLAQGALVAVAVALLVVMGRARFLLSVSSSLALHVIVSALFLFQEMDEVALSNAVWSLHANPFSWQRWAVAIPNGSMFCSFLIIAISNYIRATRSTQTLEIAHIKRCYNGASTLFEYLHMTLSGDRNLADRVGERCRLETLDKETFECVVPVVQAGTPRSCRSYLMQGFITIFCVCSPVAVFSFAAGTANPSLINVILLLVGLVQFSQQETIHWQFHRTWWRFMVGYFSLILLPLVFNIPVIAEWVDEHSNFAGIIGIYEDDGVVGLDALRVVLLWVVLLQTRVYGDFQYEAILRTMYYDVTTRETKHLLLLKHLQAVSEEEVAAARARDKELHDKLQQIRTTSSYIIEAVQISVAAEKKKNNNNASSSAVQEANGQESSSVAFDSTGDFGEQQREKEDEQEEATSDSRRRPQKIAEGEAVEEDDDENALAHESSEVNPLEQTVRPHRHARNDDEDDEEEADGKKNRRSLYRKSKALSFVVGTMGTVKDYVNSSIDAVLEAMILFTFRSRDLSSTKYPERWLRFTVITLCVLERHTAEIVLIAATASFAYSGVFWDMVPFFFIIAIASTYKPFAPLFVYDLLAQFVVIGVVAKAFAGIIAAQIVLGDGLASLVTWMFIRIPRNENAQYTTFDQWNFADLFLNFLVFATVVVHRHISFANGVFPATKPSQQSYSAYDEDEKAIAEKKAAENNSRNNYYSTSVVSNNSGLDIRHPRQVVANFVSNAVTVRGVGRDVYLQYLLLDTVALLILTFNYYTIAGKYQGSIIQNVQENLLPGPFVLALLISLLVMLVDRILYVTQNMHGKLCFNLLNAVALGLLFVVWRNYVEPQQIGAGVAYFVFKSLYLFVSCLQLRFGFPKHRRHDPFTLKPDDILPWLGYTVFRAVPFLWELKVTTDWTVMKTALRLNCYLKVEDLYDTVYNRYVAIGDARTQQPVLGTAIRGAAKISDGALRIFVMFFAIIFPLMYYSTFNPAMQNNLVTSLTTTLSLESTPVFDSALFAVPEYPGDLPLWLSRTRPLLGSYGIDNGDKAVQLLEISSCSNNLWTISPQGQRQLVQRLNQTVTSGAPFQIQLQTQLSLSSQSSGASSTALQVQHVWNMPQSVASDLLTAVSNNTKNDSAIIRLPNFYSPYIFNAPSSVQFFSDMVSNHTIDTEDCSIQLRAEPDSVLNTGVRYWCLKCNSIFSESNFPVDNTTAFPEWNCITTGYGCNNYNFEAYKTRYTPVPMYYVVFSDQVPTGLSFLPNVGIIAIYTTFVFALGRVFRSMFADAAHYVIQSDMADPKPVGQLIEYISIARECGDLRLEQSLYFELIDLLRSPEKLLKLTGYNKRLYDVTTAEMTVTSMPTDVLHDQDVAAASAVEDPLSAQQPASQYDAAYQQPQHQPQQQ